MTTSFERTAAARALLAGVLLVLGACAGEIHADGSESLPPEAFSEDPGFVSAPLVKDPTLNAVYRVQDSDTCQGGDTPGVTCDPAASVPCPGAGATCVRGAQRCVGGTKAGTKCTHHSTCLGGGTCYGQGTKLWNASSSTGTAFSMRLASNSDVKLVDINPKNGRYKVERGTETTTPTWGWIDTGALFLHHAPNSGLSTTRTEALMRGRSAMGFSYWWGHHKWLKAGPSITCDSSGNKCVSNAGECTVNKGATGCKDCSHKPTGAVEYGSDCSGFVTTIWQLDKDKNPEIESDDDNAFATEGFMKESPRLWTTVSQCPSTYTCMAKSGVCNCFDKVLPGDAVVTDGHIFLAGTKASGGTTIKSYECRGCIFGCLAVNRVMVEGTPDWHAIRKVGW